MCPAPDYPSPGTTTPSPCHSAPQAVPPLPPPKLQVSPPGTPERPPRPQAPRHRRRDAAGRAGQPVARRRQPREGRPGLARGRCRCLGRLTCSAGGERAVAISSSKLVVPTVTNTDFMAAGTGRAGLGAARGRRAPAQSSRNGGRAEGRDGAGGNASFPHGPGPPCPSLSPTVASLHGFFPVRPFRRGWCHCAVGFSLTVPHQQRWWPL